MSELTLFPAAGDSDPGASPFDRIRHLDESGEHWFGRELQVLMGYAKWQDFAATIERARHSLTVVQGEAAVQGNFTSLRKVSGERGPAGQDVRLSRFGAYLTAMEGDASKIQVAAARIYFAVRTREAEMAPAPAPALTDLLGRTELSNRQYIQLVTDTLSRLAETEERLAIEAAARQEAEVQVERDAPKVQFVDEFVAPQEGAVTLRVFAGNVGVKETDLREYLIARQVIYREFVKGGNQYHPRAEYGRQGKGWFVEREQPRAPRRPDGRMRTTLDITPVGMVKIREMLARHPLAGTDVWE